uniref:Salivary secreted peptide n=1 Tax=Anopheles minimus TaxID=112268 RepID=A0A182WMZ1_9DIPT
MKYVFVALLLMALVCALVAQPVGSNEDNSSVSDESRISIVKRYIPLGWLQALQSQVPESDSNSSEE